MQRPESSGAVPAFSSVLDLVSVSSEALDGAGATGAMTGMADGHSSTITRGPRTVETSVTTDFITVISPTVTSATAATMVDSTGLRVFTALQALTELPASTGVPTLTQRQGCTRARSVALTTAEMSEAFRPAGGRALAAADSMEAAATAVVDVTK